MLEVPLTNSGKKVLISDEDLDLLALTWCINRDNGKGYAYCTNTTSFERRALHLIIASRLGLKGEIDHKDRNYLNAQRDNLRSCTHSQNMHSKIDPKTGDYRGVSISKDGRIKAYISRKNRTIYLGTFDTEIAAAEAYDRAAYGLFKEFAVLNFPE